MQDNVNTIGQIFTNYQAALHQFEAAVQDGGGEAVPRELAKEVLREAARDVFEPVLAAAAETAGEVADHVEDGFGVTDVAPGRDAARARRERPRVRAAQPAGRRAPPDRRDADAACSRARSRSPTPPPSGPPTGGARYRKRLLGANVDLNELEETTHSAAGIFKAMMDRYKEAAKGRAEVRIVLDADWRVVRAHITAPRGNKLAGQLLADHSGWFDLNDLHLPRHITWEPAELATCEALIDARGGTRRLDRNEKGGAFFDEFQQRLRADGLPGTRVLTGD